MTHSYISEQEIAFLPDLQDKITKYKSKVLELATIKSMFQKVKINRV